MVNKNIECALSILSHYPEITVMKTNDHSISFSMGRDDFLLCLLQDAYQHNDAMPFLTSVDEKKKSYPHILTRSITIKNQFYQAICLYEEEMLVKSLMTTEEKIDFVISQLHRLIFLNSVQQEREYQKEFGMYWNQAAGSNDLVDLYLKSTTHIACLNVYFSDKRKYENMRIVSPDIYMNDIEGRTLNKKTHAIYIPIVDSRGILPPVDGQQWTVLDILKIIDDVQIARISDENYKKMSMHSYSSKSIFLVFEMAVNQSTVSFCCEIIFENAGTMKLLKKIKDNTQSVKIYRTKRMDYEFLNRQIGNDISLAEKKVAIIGVGSLGSYIASEIIRSGIRKVVLVDKDILLPENIMRYRSEFWGCYANKAKIISLDLERIHPQIETTVIKEYITADNLMNLLPNDVDLVIFSMGSSSIQLDCNWVLKKNNFDKPVLFSWLEADRDIGHAMGIHYSQQGCFQCMFTDDNGNWINNKVNLVTDVESEKRIIRNGCGGTRVAYGNASLLQTTYMTLKATKIVFSNDFTHNFIFTFDGKCITEDTVEFWERSCSCCHEDSV